jgi:uncharacterized membrane protein YdjX (TVP38/TMEM64 family)
MRRSSMKKVAIVILVIGLFALFKILHLDQYLTLTYIKASQGKFALLYAEHTVVVVAAYTVVYILVTSLSLPGAAVLTIAGGAIFGLWTGTLIVSFASTIGATIACSVSRFLLRDWVQSRFTDKISRINNEIEKEGAFYLFTLRLIPIFPFWIINLVIGVTKISLFTFYWISQVGMLPGTIVYINAGKELAKIESISGMLSPSLIFSFVLLGLFPITVKKLMALYRSRTGKTTKIGLSSKR